MRTHVANFRSTLGNAFNRKNLVATIGMSACLGASILVTAGPAHADPVTAQIVNNQLFISGDDTAQTITLTALSSNTKLEIDVDGGIGFIAPRNLFTSIAIDTFGGDDTIRFPASGTFKVPTTINGGLGNDTIVGGSGSETIFGGPGDDVLSGGGGNDNVIGQQGNDVVSLGSGNDVATWNPGDGSDSIDGGSGTDQLVFSGSNIGENIDLSANGKQLRLTRDVGAVTMSLNAVEHVGVLARAGADHITVNDLKGTGVSEVDADLSAQPSAGPDSTADNVVVNGTNGVDKITVAGSGGAVSVRGLTPAVKITGIDAALDTLEVNTLGGNDSVNTKGLAPGTINLITR